MVGGALALGALLLSFAAVPVAAWSRGPVGDGLLGDPDALAPPDLDRGLWTVASNVLLFGILLRAGSVEQLIWVGTGSVVRGLSNTTEILAVVPTAQRLVGTLFAAAAAWVFAWGVLRPRRWPVAVLGGVVSLWCLTATSARLSRYGHDGYHLALLGGLRLPMPAGTCGSPETPVWVPTVSGGLSLRPLPFSFVCTQTFGDCPQEPKVQRVAAADPLAAVGRLLARVPSGLGPIAWPDEPVPAPYSPEAFPEAVTEALATCHNPPVVLAVHCEEAPCSVTLAAVGWFDHQVCPGWLETFGPGQLQVHAEVPCVGGTRRRMATVVTPRSALAASVPGADADEVRARMTLHLAPHTHEEWCTGL
jgi:hypothetical protein